MSEIKKKTEINTCKNCKRALEKVRVLKELKDSVRVLCKCGTENFYYENPKVAKPEVKDEIQK